MKRLHLRRGKTKWVLLFLFGIIIISAAYRGRWDYLVFKRGLPPPSKFTIAPVKTFDFSREDSLKEWEEKVFKGKVVYRIEKGEGRSYVKAVSNGAASALYYKVKIDAKTEYPVISWKWRVQKFPEKKFRESLDKELEDDFAARVYVIFPPAFILNSRVLEYVWAESLPVGAMGTSPYSENIKLIVLRSGLDKDNIWLPEERDIVSDYITMFGRKPEYNIGAVAFMTNTEHTGSSAEAEYGDISIGYKKAIQNGGK